MSWRVYRSALIMVGAAGPAEIDAYYLGLERLLMTHGSWAIISDADTDARAGRWDRVAEMQAENPSPTFTPDRPWG